MGCNCGGSSYGASENAPGETDPFYWTGVTPPSTPDKAEKPKPAPKATDK